MRGTRDWAKEQSSPSRTSPIITSCLFCYSGTRINLSWKICTWQMVGLSNHTYVEHPPKDACSWVILYPLDWKTAQPLGETKNKKMLASMSGPLELGIYFFPKQLFWGFYKNNWLTNRKASWYISHVGNKSLRQLNILWWSKALKEGRRAFTNPCHAYFRILKANCKRLLYFLNSHL